MHQNQAHNTHPKIIIIFFKNHKKSFFFFSFLLFLVIILSQVISSQKLSNEIFPFSIFRLIPTNVRPQLNVAFENFMIAEKESGWASMKEFQVDFDIFWSISGSQQKTFSSWIGYTYLLT